MRAITPQQADDWCSEHGLYSMGIRVRCVDICKVYESKIPLDTTGIIQCIQAAMYEERQIGFCGGLIYFTEWELNTRRITTKIMERLRGSYGVADWPMTCPGHLFAQNEIDDYEAFVALAALFQWEGHFIPTHGKYFMFLHEPDRLYIAVRENVPTMIDAIGKLCPVRELAPKDVWYRAFCQDAENNPGR